MKPAHPPAPMAVVVAAPAGSIEHTKPLNAECLQSRECVSGLTCQPAADGRYVCMTVYEGGLPAAPEAGADAVDDADDAGGADDGGFADDAGGADAAPE